MPRSVLNVTAFAVAMANVETMIVVYLRRLYYSERGGFSFPLVIIDTPTLVFEVLREACTIVMLAGFGVAAGRTKSGKLAYFLLAFGVWDIFYYVWLKLLLDWPASLLTWDVLFLIPVPWIGPVVAPVSVACTMIAIGLTLLRMEERGIMMPAKASIWLAQAVAACIIILSFTIDVVPRLDPQGTLLAQWVPTTYHWWMLILGQALCISTFAHWARRAWRTQAYA